MGFDPALVITRLAAPRQMAAVTVSERPQGLLARDGYM